MHSPVFDQSCLTTVRQSDQRKKTRQQLHFRYVQRIFSLYSIYIVVLGPRRREQGTLRNRHPMRFSHGSDWFSALVSWSRRLVALALSFVLLYLLCLTFPIG